MKTRVLISFAAVAVALTVGARAETTPSAAVALDELVVSATRTERRANETPGTAPGFNTILTASLRY